MRRLTILGLCVWCIGLLAACSSEPGGNGNNPPPPPENNSFTFSIEDPIDVNKNGETTFKATMNFGNGYDDWVRIRTGEATPGLSVWNADKRLNDEDVIFQGSGELDLTLKASGDAEDFNAFVVIIAQGITERGSVRGLPKKDINLRVNVR